MGTSGRGVQWSSPLSSEEIPTANRLENGLGRDLCLESRLEGVSRENERGIRRARETEQWLASVALHAFDR